MSTPTKSISLLCGINIVQGPEGEDDFDYNSYRQAATGMVSTRISDREDGYKSRRLGRMLSPERGDGLSGETPVRSYKDIMAERELDKEEASLRRAIIQKKEEDAKVSQSEGGKKRRRWDNEETPLAGGGSSQTDATPLLVHATPIAGSVNKWDATPVAGGVSTNAWDATPLAEGAEPGKKRSRWDATPVNMTPSIAAAGAGTSTAMITPEMTLALRWEMEVDARNRPMTDEELDQLIPIAGYKILKPPDNYMPIANPSKKLLATPTPMGMTPAFQMAATPARDTYGITTVNELGDDLPSLKPEDMQFFGKLVDEKDDDDLSPEEARDRKIMKLILKIKNGAPPTRKVAMRQLSDRAREFGAGPLFNQILPLLMSPALEDQERHLLVKVIDRILYKLEDLVRPYVHKILVVIEPLLIDEDYFARVEGRQIISNLSKAAGLATMIATMRPDIDDPDEYVRNTTARAFSVVASALGVPSMLPFLKAVCQSRKSWQARHTGIKIVQQIAILMGCAVLPHLTNLVEIVGPGLEDDQQKVRTIAALATSALAEAAYPYGIESFGSVLQPLGKGIQQHRGKSLAAFLKAIGYIVPLMEPEHARLALARNRDGKPALIDIVVREFATADEEMKKIVLKVVKQCVSTDGVDPAYVKEAILPEFFRNFWVRRMALDRRNYRQLVDTTEEIANNVGCAEVVRRIVDDLKDENEPYRKMVIETIHKAISNLGAADIDHKLEENLVDGILYAFQEQSGEDNSPVLLDSFGTVVNALGVRVKPYLPQITGTIKWRLQHKDPKVRMQAADLVSRIAVVIMACEESSHLSHLGVLLFEYLGEEYPDVLGSILNALKAIVNVIGMSNMQPPIKDLLPRLTPILKNRHEKVQENCIDLVGRIADRGAEHANVKEWMRICFELLELLKAHKKAIRRAAVNTFGYIAKAIGPQDVLHILLNNLKVQERQNRVCTTVAIGIVAETCQPFTVLPALMNEYRIPELNVQNGVLKAISFLFEYIGEMGRDYIYAVTPLLEDALMDRDMVHRQTAAVAVKHMALGVQGLGCEDSLVHLLNFIWPNIFEQSPHVIKAMFDAIEAIRVAVGPGRLMLYTLQGLFHPARRIRETYWKIYNNMYVYGQDALTPYYPRLEDDDINKYRREYLDMHM